MFDTDCRQGLADTQLQAVEHGDGPLVVVAGAGTGKTRTLTSRVAALIERGVRADRVLLLTFTRRASADMVSRAAALCGDRSAARRVWGGTFHAIAHRLIVEHAQVLGLGAVSILDPADVTDLLDLMRDEHGLSGTKVRLPPSQVLADVCSRSVNTHRPARDVIAVDFPQYEHCTGQILPLLKEFMARKRVAGLLDFDDLLVTWRALLTDSVVGPRLRARWDHVLVDEYQDVNQIQVDIVTALRPDGHGLTVVGDDAQAVYGFRGASGAHLLDLAYTMPDATVVRLENNFRSVQPLLDLANAVRPAGDPAQEIVLRADRESGTTAKPALHGCYDADDQARRVADAVLAAHEEGQPLREQAVLMRAASHSRELELELAHRRIPFVKYGGLRFIETAHVKDFVAALRVSANPRDEVAWYRLLKLHRDIGKARARALTALLIEPGDIEPAGRYENVVGAAPDRARDALGVTLHALAEAATTTLVRDRVRLCLQVVQPLVRATYQDAALRLDDLDQLASSAKHVRDLGDFVAGLTLDPAAASTDYARPPQVDDDYLILSTVHSAKGLEWDTVHLLHAIDGAFPSDMALHDPDGLAEEHRLFYVAVTRARDSLTIYAPRRMHRDRNAHTDRHVYAQPSRFLTADALATLDIAAAEQDSTGAEFAPPPATVAIPAMSELFA
jgi:DNA helicase II / ATP-dependent DNA helicase PcrA